MAIKLIIGADPSSPLFVFERADIRSRSLQVVTAVDVVGSELAADELYADIDHAAGENLWFSPADYDGVMSSDGFIIVTTDVTADLSVVPFATPVWIMDGSTVLHRLYFSKAEQIDPRTYSLTAISGVGLLDRRRHRGNLYTGQSVAAVLDEIIGDAFPYTVDPAVAAQAVYGLLLPDTARTNLHSLMFAMGISLIKGVDGGANFVYLDGTISGAIPADRIFIGGSVTYQTPITAVEVTEHSYFQGQAELVTIFDNNGEAAVTSVLIEFDDAYHSLSTAGNLSVNEYGPTYAVVSGSGTLTGTPYIHNTRVTHLDASNVASGENVLKSDADTLINSLNGLAVAHRLLAYYTSKKTVDLPVRIEGEKAGQNVTFADPFSGASENGFILKSDSVVSGFERSNLKLICGYTPTGQGNWYNSRMVVNASGSVTLPAEVDHIRLVLIGGGDGGQGGTNGQAGYGGDTRYGGSLTYVDNRPDGDLYFEYSGGSQNTPEGGAAGAAGAAGKVFVTDIDITSGATLSFSVGVGGAGGQVGGSNGQAGTATTVSIVGTAESYSSVNGSNVSAYVDPITGDGYALPGEVGHRGGDGGLTDLQNLHAFSGSAGYNGEGCGPYSGGIGGSGRDDWIRQAYVSGGGGGGAAWGANGGAGGDATWYVSRPLYRATPGNGGNGGNAVTPTTPTYGSGGGGGNGGGAGGNGAGCKVEYALNNVYVYAGAGGSAGAGSPGGQGGAGVAFIYY